MEEDMLRWDEVHPVYHHLWWRGLIDDDVDFFQFLTDFVAAKTS